MSETFNKKDANARFRKALIGALSTEPKTLTEIVSERRAKEGSAKKRKPRKRGA